MFGSTGGGANAYAKVGLETGVTTASPHQLIVMLFEGALIAISTATQQMKAGDIAAKGQAISKAISIINSGLRASLNKEAGGEIGQNLDALYEYLSNRLLLANLNNDLEILAEVDRLLRELKGAWDAIGTSSNVNSAATQAADTQPARKAPAYDALAPSTSRLIKA
jgi:flagellar protein FliS